MIMIEYGFDYSLEPHRDIICVDVKSFFASVECVLRGYHPLKTMLVVMSNAQNNGGLVLAASPLAKKVLGISNVTRKYELPDHPDLIVVPPRMTHYIEKNSEINNIYRKYVSDDDLHIYSIDESFLDITASLRLFKKKNAYELARMIQYHIYKKTGLYVTIGIGDNPLLAKLALDNAAKHNHDFIAEWRYQNIAETLWKIPELTDVWGIGQKTALRLNKMKIHSVADLAHTDFYQLKSNLGVIGAQLYANAWGIDRSRLSEKYQPLEKSYGNSQVLMRDYRKITEIKVVIREMAEQVATRIRKHHCRTACVMLTIGYSRDEFERGFSRQVKIPPTANSKELTQYCFDLFDKFYNNQAVRTIAISYSKLVYNNHLQLNLFQKVEEQIANETLDTIVDRVRDKYGFKAIIHASSLTEGATAVSRSSLVGGHAGGMEGIQ